MPHTAAATQAGGIDEHHLFPIHLDDGVNRIARGTGDVVHDHAVLTQHGVEDGTLAHIRATDDAERRQAVDPLVVYLLDLGEALHKHVEEVSDAAAMQCRHAHHLAEAEAPQRLGAQLGLVVVALVGHNDDGPVRATKPLGNLEVAGGGPRHGVDDEQDQIGFVNCPDGL